MSESAPDPQEYVDAQFSGSNSSVKSDAEFTADDSTTDIKTTNTERTDPTEEYEGSSEPNTITRIVLFYLLSVSVISLILSTSMTFVSTLQFSVFVGVIPVVVLYLSPLSCIPKSD
jgi:amino acid permease